MLAFAFVVFASAGTLIGSPSTAAAAGAVQDRYCLQGRQSGYPGNCAFSSYRQCMATASGTDEGCGINPMHADTPPYRSENRGSY